MGFTDWLSGLDWTVLTDKLFYAAAALLCITIHELSHGFVAYKLGDDTAKNAKRLTFNPIRHVDPIGLILLIFQGFGWAKPVPINMNNFKNPKRGMAVSALAGPVSNFILAVLFLCITGLLYALFPQISMTVFNVLLYTAYLSISLGLFNLIPIPPLDGSKVLFSFLPEKAYLKLMHYERYGMILLMILLFTGVVSQPLGRAAEYLYDVLWSLPRAIINILT